jgi:ABC-2 type transport system ATP-binding protein
LEEEPLAEGARRGVRVEADALTRRFGDQLALDGVSFSISEGEAFGLLGPNGAGKTTFIRCLTGALLPSGGEIRVNGTSPARDPGAARAQLGFVAETSRLYGELRVTSFLGFCAGARGLAGSARRQAVERVVERFTLGEVAKRLVGHLSKGFQQRVSLAQAFLTDPPLVIVDEPTGGLDPVQQDEVRSLLRSLRGERTLLLCTHDLPEARMLTERVAVLNRGRLVTVGSTEETLAGDALALFRTGAAA